MRRIAAALALLAAPALAETPAATTETFVCDGGAVARIAFLNAGGESFAVVDHGGLLIVMRAVPTGSGVFYVDLDEQRGWRWRGKGAEGFLARLSPDHAAAEETVLSGCVAAGR